MTHGKHLTKTAAGMVAVLLFVFWTSPDNPIQIETARPDDTTYRGVFHVHSTESDGGGTAEEIAEAARGADLDFVVLTDHGDGTNPTPPRYIDDVLILAGVEISTNGGHYIALGMPQSPYPLGGDAKGVVEDVRRLGGFGVVAHPYSPREALRWQDFTLPVDAIEWINGDSQWRGAGVMPLLSASLHYWLRPVGSLNALLYRPIDTMNMWNAMASNRHVTGLAGVDAHARLATGSGEEGYTGGFVVRFPWYEDLFRLFGIYVSLDRTLTKNAEADSRSILASLKTGQFYSTVESQATSTNFIFFGTRTDGTTVKMGETTPGNQDLHLLASVGAPAGAVIHLLRNGTIAAESAGLQVAHTVSASSSASVYRVEVYLSENHVRDGVPWLVSNPIFVGRSESEGPPTVPTDGGYELNPDAWRTEQHSDAEARLGSNDGIVTFAYALGNSPGTYAAIAYSLERSDIELDGFIDFVVSASKPMRISAQLRRGASRDYRWRHSFYVDQRARRIQLPIRDFASVGLTIGSGGAAADIDSLLFVADTVNHDRNASGELHISQLRIRD
jgi:hypothetical protein